MPKRLVTSSNHWRSTLRPAISVGKVIFSSAVKVGTKLKDWKIKPRRSRRIDVVSLSFNPDKLVSPINAEPDDARSRPAIVCINVDLPEPDGPMIAVNLLRANSILMWSKRSEEHT